MSEIEVEPGQADEVIARAVTLLALIDPKALGARTLSDRIKVPQSAVRALADTGVDVEDWDEGENRG